MKNTNTFQKIAFIVLFLVGTTILPAQSRMVKVNPATNEVTVKNFSMSMNEDVSGWFLCIFPNYPQLSTLTGANLDLAPGTSVTFTSSINISDTGDGEVALYHTGGNFNNPANMADYMQWGSSPHAREDEAVTAGLWTAGTFINVPAPFNYLGNGSQNGVAFWETSLGLDDPGLNSQILVFPNPSANTVNVNFGRTISSGKMFIADIQGRLILSRSITNSDSEDIDVRQWSQGLYFISMQTSEGAITKRFLKK